MRNGGATLFLTTLTRTREPIVSSPSLMPVIFANVEPHRAVELQRQAAGGRLRIAEHHADLLANLVDEHHARLASAKSRVEDAQGLAHEPGLQADVRIADLAFDFVFRHQGGDGVDDDHVHGVRLDRASRRSSAPSSAHDGWLTSKSSRSTPIRLAQAGSRACSASMNAATPPSR